jgi:hypothetical protein
MGLLTAAVVLATAGPFLGSAQGLAPAGSTVLGDNSTEPIAIPPAAGRGDSPDRVRCFNASALSPGSFPSASFGGEPDAAATPEAVGTAATPASSVPVAMAPKAKTNSTASTAAPGTAAPVQERSGGAAVSLSALFTWPALTAALAALLG